MARTDAGTGAAQDDLVDFALPDGVTLPDLEVANADGSMRRLRVEPTGDRERADEGGRADDRARDDAPARDDDRDDARGRGGFGPAAREERAKRKRLQSKLTAIEAERDRVLAVRAGGAGVPSSRIRAITKEQLEERLKKLKTDADAAESMGDVAVRIFHELRGDLLSLDEDLVDRVDFKTARMSERTFKRITPDYDVKLRRAGVFEAMRLDQATKQFADPVIARRVFGAESPAEEAYEIAEAILDQRGELDERGRLKREPDGRDAGGARDEDRGERERERGRPAPRDDERDRDRRAERLAVRDDQGRDANDESGDEFDEDRDERSEHQSRRREERRPDRDRGDRGAGDGDRGRPGERAFDRLPETPTRFRGIRRLTDAGSGARARISREYLDELMDRNHELYQQVAPDGSPLQRWHLQEEVG